MKKIAVKWMVFLLCLACFLLIAFHLDDLAPVDSAVYHAVSSLISPAATRFALGCTNIISPLVLLVVTAAALLLLPQKEYRAPLLLNLSIGVLLNLGLKSVFVRPRPTEVQHLAVESGYSFPSGHTMAAACFYGFLIYLVWTLCTNKALRNALCLLFSAIIVLVAASRVYLGVHYFTDVLGGILISVCFLVVFTSFVSRFFANDEPLKPKNILPNHRNRLLFSFAYAAQGVVDGLKSERNMIIHLGAMAAVIVFGALLRISATEWLVCVGLFGAMFMAELMNTAIETVVDMVCPHVDPRAKLAKDTAAGAVLCMAIAAAVAGGIIFIPKILQLL